MSAENEIVSLERYTVCRGDTRTYSRRINRTGAYINCFNLHYAGIGRYEELPQLPDANDNNDDSNNNSNFSVYKQKRGHFMSASFIQIFLLYFASPRCLIHRAEFSTSA